MNNNNPDNEKFILQETRHLNRNEFVFTHSDAIPYSPEASRMWDYLCETYGFTKQSIDPRELPIDNQGHRMTGFRIVRDEDA